MSRLFASSLRLLLLAVFVCSVVTGCSLFKEQPVKKTQATPEPPAPTPSPRPQLAAARDHQINLFGEMPDRRDVPYFTRTAASLLQHTYSEEGADFDPCISPDGNWMVFASTRHNQMPDLYYKQVDGIAVTQLTSDPASDIHPVYSPNGQKIAFASNRSGNWDIWIVALDGTPPQQITNGAGDEIHPSWSPDGSRLVYCSLPQRGQWELWVADATNGGGNKRFFGYGLFPEWSPVEDVILYQRARERGSHWFSVWTVQLVNGEPRYPTEVAAAADAAFITPSWSTDGSQIAFTAVAPTSTTETSTGVPSGQADIWMVDTDGRNRVRLTDGHTANFGPAWSRSGRIYFTSGREGHESIWSVEPMPRATGPAPATTAANRQMIVDDVRPAMTASDDS